MIFAPLMRQRHSAGEVLREVAPLTGRLPAEHQEPTVNALLGLAYHYVDEAVVRSILEKLSMANPLITMFQEREAKVRRQNIQTVLQARFGTIPETIERRIAAVNMDELDTLLVRAVTVKNLDEF